MPAVVSGHPGFPLCLCCGFSSLNGSSNSNFNCLAGFRPRTTRFLRLGSGPAFCFGKRTQSHFRLCASLRGFSPPYRITWLRNSLRSDSARRMVGFGTAARPYPRGWEEINQKKIREILRKFLIQSKGQAFGGAAGFF